MLRKLRDFWKDWWPFLSGAPIAIYTVWAYFSNAKNTIFLFAHLFRWELLFLFVVLGVIALIHVFTSPENLLRPSNSVAVARSTLRNFNQTGAKGLDRFCSALLALTLVVFAGVFIHYAFKTYGFLHDRYHHVDRQSMVAEAGRLEKEQDLPQAISQYQRVLEEFPFNRFNSNVEDKIAELKARNANWEAASRNIRRLQARWGPNKASTWYDSYFQSCRYISNSEPCTKLKDYLVPVRKIMNQTQRPGASCDTIVSQTPRELFWIYLDPNDARWIGIEGRDGVGVCRSLGLGSADDLATYLDGRWYLSQLADDRQQSPEKWSWAFD